MNTPNQEPDLILVVDDTPKNLQVLGTILHEKGFDVAAATSGAQALSILEHTSPGLILLDVMMPEMDGYQVLARLKENIITAEIPVIFITARVELEDVVKGFNAGAVDYITKPFNATELLSRVNVHLTLKKNRDQLSSLNRKLRKQARELKNLNQEKNEMLGIVAHDLKNPLANIMGIAENMANPNYLYVKETLSRDAERLVRTSQGMFKLINNLLNINAIEAGGLELVSERIHIGSLVEQIISLYKSHTDRKRLAIHCFFDTDGRETFQTDPNAIHQILDNIISNAIKYSPAGASINITVSVKLRGQHYLGISVSDQGQGLTPDDMEQLFGKFKRLSAKPTADESSTGLGLAIAKKLTDRLGGSIHAESTPGEGATFIVTIPEMVSAIVQV